MGPTNDLSHFIFLTVSMSCVPVEGEWSGCAKREREREFQGEKRRNKSVGKNSHPKNQAILRLF